MGRTLKFWVFAIITILFVGLIWFLTSGPSARDLDFPAKELVINQALPLEMDVDPSIGVVRFVHQTWKTKDLPPRFQRWSRSWRQCFPKARHILWTDEDNRLLIAKYYPWFLRRFDSLPSSIYRADAIRYILLFHFGGIYTDLDNECLRPFGHLLTGKQVVLGAMNGSGNIDEGYVQNSFMYSVPRHPVWLDMVHHILFHKGTSLGASVGSEGLVNVVKAYRKRMNSKKDITIYPPKYFNPFSWKINQFKFCKHFNHMSDDELAKCRNTFRNTSYVVQYHAHTWGGGKIL